jgi:hypothetical protein
LLLLGEWDLWRQARRDGPGFYFQGFITRMTQDMVDLLGIYVLPLDWLVHEFVVFECVRRLKDSRELVRDSLGLLTEHVSFEWH